MAIGVDMNMKIAVIVPYFGKLPEFFLGWKISALKNPMLEFWLFTDDKEVKSEGNINVKHMEFSEFVSIIQRNFDFQIECSQPYKLCDYKPAFGDIFKDELRQYDFWGYCDIDVILGDVKKFYTNRVLGEYDKINIDGHISLFRNNDKMNLLYRSFGKYPEYNYTEAFTTSDTCYFDEYRGMELKLLREKCKVFSDRSDYINVNPKKRVFYGKNGKQIVARWENGKLFTIDEEGVSKEIMYIHICKRKMMVDKFSSTTIGTMSIVPGRVIFNDKTEVSKLFSYSSGSVLYPYLWSISRLKFQLKRYSLKKIIELNIRSRQIRKLRAELMN